MITGVLSAYRIHFCLLPFKTALSSGLVILDLVTALLPRPLADL